MRKLCSVLLMTGLSLGMYSCYYDQEQAVTPLPEIPADQPISFVNDIEPLFSSPGRDCTACHNGSVQNPDLREGNSYNALVPNFVTPGDAEGSAFYQHVPGNNHPFDVGFTLPVDEIALIKSWIDRGAENN